MLGLANYKYLTAKAELNIKQTEFKNIQEAFETAQDAVSGYKDTHDNVKNDTRYLILKAEEDKLERDKDRLEEDVELLESELKSLDDLLKDGLKETKNIEF